MKKIIKIAVACFIFLLCNIIHAEKSTHREITPSPLDQQTTQANEILIYIDKKLQDAGFSKENRAYILDISKQQISTSSAPVKFNKELIDKNIYMLIKKLTIKDQASSLLVSEKITQASAYKAPENYVVASGELAFFNSHSVFSDVTPLDIQKAINKICPLFPFCQGPTKPKKKR